MNDYEFIYYYKFESNIKVGEILFKKYEGNINKITHIIYRKFNAIPLEFQDLKFTQYESFINSLNQFKEKANKTFYNYMQLRLKWDILQYIRKFINKNQSIINYASNYDYYVQWLEFNNPYSRITVDEPKIFNSKLSYLTEMENNIILLKAQNYSNSEIIKKLNIKYKSLDNAYQRAKIKIKKYKNNYFN